MTHKIFLSYNHNDQPLVEPIALRLANIFGQDAVFYDVWSIKPGDGIIDRMNSGLAAPEFVFFFVSATSLASGMVKLEWQNALMSATKGKTRLIPVRVDGAEMPPILKQNLYIDMHTHGLEYAILQIANVAQGNEAFAPSHQGFSNLTYTAITGADRSIAITIRASHLMEPHPRFMLVVDNTEEEISWSAPGYGGFNGGFFKAVPMDNGSTPNVVVMRPMEATLTPAHSVRLQLSPKGETPVNLRAVLHEAAEGRWVPVPLSPRP